MLDVPGGNDFSRSWISRSPASIATRARARNAASPSSSAIEIAYTGGNASARSTIELAGSSGATSNAPGVCHAIDWPSRP